MKQNIILIAIAGAALLISGCGGQKDGKANAEKSGKTSSEEVVDTYLVHLTAVADAVENVEDEKTAKKAAEVIAKATKEMEAMASEVEGMSAMQRGMLFARRAQDFVEPQTRLAVSLQKMAMENPEYFEMIQAEMEKMPDFQE